MIKKTRVASILIGLILMSMSACNKQPLSVADTGAKAPQESFSATVGDEEAESDKAVTNGEDVYWKPDIEGYTTAVRVTINPDAILYLNNEEVVGVAFLNEDAKTIYDTSWMLSRNYKDVLYDMLKGAAQAGVLDKGQVKVEVAETVGDGEPLDFVYDYPVEVLKRVEEESKVQATVLLDGRNEEEWSDYKESDEHKERVAQNESQNGSQNESNATEPAPQPGTIECTVCHGTGNHTCEVCGGTGEVMTIVQYEEYVRNDYVCPTCGGKGWIDDGMHGGETAECGFCTTNGGSAPFKEKAYDVVIVDEEVPEQCPNCGGSGKARCTACNGAGFN